MSGSILSQAASRLADSAAPAGEADALVILIVFVVVALAIAAVAVVLSRIGRR